MARHGVTEFLRVFQNDAAVFAGLEHDFFVKLDQEGNIVWVNQAFERRLNRKKSEMIGRPVVVIVCADDLAKFFRSFYSSDHEPFRLLHQGYGVVTVRLLEKRFIQTDEGQRGFLIFRPVAHE